RIAPRNLLLKPRPSSVMTKLCLIPELLTKPVPLTVRTKAGPVLRVKALASGLNVIPATSIESERETSVVFDTPKVATSDGPFGTVFGVQLLAVLQSPV